MANPATVAELKKLFQNNSTNREASNITILKSSLKESNHQSKQSVKFKLESEKERQACFNRNVKKELCQMSNGLKSISKKFENTDFRSNRTIESFKRKENHGRAPKSKANKSEERTTTISPTKNFMNESKKQLIAYKIDLSEIVRNSENIDEDHFTNIERLEGFYGSRLTGDEVPSMTTSEDSGFLPDHSSSSCKESGSEISNQDSFVERKRDEQNWREEKVLEGVIVSTGSHNCVAFEKKNYKNDDWNSCESNYNNKAGVPKSSYHLTSYNCDNNNNDTNHEIVDRHEGETHSGHYKKKSPTNKQRVESVKKHSFHQRRQHNKHRRSRSVTKISVGGDDVEDTVYFSEPEFNYDDDDDDDVDGRDDDDDDWYIGPGNPYRTRSQDFEIRPYLLYSSADGARRLDDSNITETNFEHEKMLEDKTGKNSIGKMRPTRRHTCEVDFRRDQEFGARVGNTKFECGNQYNLNGKLVKRPIRRTLSDISFAIDLSDITKQNDNYRVSLVMSPTDDQIFASNENSFNLYQQDKAVQTQDISINQSHAGKDNGQSKCLKENFESKILQPQQQQPPRGINIQKQEIQHEEHMQRHNSQQMLQQRQQQEEKIEPPHKEIKSQRKDNFLKRIFNSSFLMAKKGFREKWTQRRSNLEREGSENKQNKTKNTTTTKTTTNENCFSGQQINKFNSKTLATRNAKTFLPQGVSIHSSEFTSADNLLDEIDGRWMNGHQDPMLSNYPMWDFGEELEKKPAIDKQNLMMNASHEHAEWIKAIDIISLLKDSSKDSISESVEILDDNINNQNCRTPTLSLIGNQLNVVTVEDFPNDSNNKRIRKSICIDMQANDCRKELLSKIIKNVKTRHDDDDVVGGGCENIDLFGEAFMEILAKLITMSEMNKLSKVKDEMRSN